MRIINWRKRMGEEDDDNMEKDGMRRNNRKERKNRT
jgi:hypothetical protein